MVRVLTYALIITIYFLKNEYVVGVAIRADMLSTSTVLAVGIVQALTCIQLGCDMQVVYGERDLWAWKTKLLVGLLVLQFSSLTTIYILRIDWVYYGFTIWEFLVSLCLYSALVYLMSVMSPFYHRINMHSELDTVRNIMSVFGLTFIVGSALNFLKGYYIQEFVDVMVKQPWFFCIFSVLSSILVELCPVVVILKMHKMNFAAPVIVVESDTATSLNS
jgi:hypothetical protein